MQMLYKSLRKCQIMHAIFRSAPRWSDSAPCEAQGSALSEGRVCAGHCPQKAMAEELALQTCRTDVASRGWSHLFRTLSDHGRQKKEEDEKIRGIEYLLAIICLASLASHLVFLESFLFLWEIAVCSVPLPRPRSEYSWCMYYAKGEAAVQNQLMVAIKHKYKSRLNKGPYYLPMLSLHIYVNNWNRKCLVSMTQWLIISSEMLK